MRYILEKISKSHFYCALYFNLWWGLYAIKCKYWSYAHNGNTVNFGIYDGWQYKHKALMSLIIGIHVTTYEKFGHSIGYKEGKIVWKVYCESMISSKVQVTGSKMPTQHYFILTHYLINYEIYDMIVTRENDMDSRPSNFLMSERLHILHVSLSMLWTIFWVM